MLPIKIYDRRSLYEYYEQTCQDSATNAMQMDDVDIPNFDYKLMFFF